MRRRGLPIIDLTSKKAMTKTMSKSDLWDIWSEWWGVNASRVGLYGSLQRSSQISLFLCDYWMLSAKINLLENGYSAKSQFGARPLPLAPALKPFSFDPLRNIGLFKSNAANMRTSIWGKPAALSKLFQPDLESSWGHANIGPAFILPRWWE